MKFGGLGPFRYMTFWLKTFWQRHFINKAFRYEEILAHVYFGMGIFWHHGRFIKITLGHCSALGHFGTRIFWHMDVSAQCKAIDISALVSLCQKILMPKYSSVMKQNWGLSIQKFDFFNDLKLYNFLKNKVLRAHAARHTPSCLWHFPKHLKSFDGCQQSHGPDIFVPNGLSHNPTFLWLPLCAIARLSAFKTTNRGARNAHFLVLDTGHRPTSSRNKLFSLSIHAQTYLQPHYNNGVFGNVYLSAGHKEVNNAGTPLP